MSTAMDGQGWLAALPDDLRDRVRAVLPPEWIEPMAATLTTNRFDDPDWLFEEKLDGIRYVTFVSRGTARMLTRNRIRHEHPDVEAALISQPHDDYVLDGEMVPFMRDRTDVPRAYHIFDVLRLDGHDVTSLPLETRKRLLSSFAWDPPLARVDELPGSGLDAYRRACEAGWEGIIAKRRDSVYAHGRSRAWLKMKCDASQELVVGGFTDPGGKRAGIGALLVGVYDGDDLVYAGRVGTGFDTRTLRELRSKLETLEVPSTPFTRGTGLPRKGAHWVRPEVVVQVSFMEWTRGGKLRHPRFSGVREDKHAGDVVRER